MSEKNITDNCCGQKGRLLEYISKCCDSNSDSTPTCCGNAEYQEKEKNEENKDGIKK